MDTTTLTQSDSYRKGEAYLATITDDELFHHGIKGMKWGVRRSQETLDRLAGRTPSKKKSSGKKKKTSSGTKSKSSSSSGVKKKISDRVEARKKERSKKREIRREGRVERAKIREQGKIAVEKAKAERAAEEARTGAGTKTDTRGSAKNLSDKELQARVNRLNLEKQYNTLTKKPKSSRDVVKDFAVKQTGKLANQAADAMIKKTIGSLIGDAATKAGEKALKDTVKATESVKMPKAASSSSVTKAMNNITKVASQAAPKNAKKPRVLDDLIDVNKMKSVKDIQRAYSYTGRRRLNKKRKVTNRR